MDNHLGFNIRLQLARHIAISMRERDTSHEPCSKFDLFLNHCQEPNQTIDNTAGLWCRYFQLILLKFEGPHSRGGNHYEITNVYSDISSKVSARQNIHRKGHIPESELQQNFQKCLRHRWYILDNTHWGKEKKLFALSSLTCRRKT